LFLAIRGIDVSLLVKSLKGLKYHYLLLTILFFFVSLLSRAFLWRCIFVPIKRVKILHLFQAIIIGYAANNVLPARAGEFVRAYAIGRSEQLRKSIVFGTIIVERLFDLLSLLIFSGFVSLYIVLPDFIRVGIYFICTLLLCVLVLIIFGLRTDSLLLKIVFFMTGFVPRRIRPWLDERIELLWSSFEIFKTKERNLYILMFSLTAWISMAVAMYFGLRSFSLGLPFYAPVLLLVILNIGVIIPSSPGFIGVFQYLCVLSLSYFNIEKSLALSFSFVLHALEYVPITLLGFFLFGKLNLSFKDLKKSTYASDQLT